MARDYGALIAALESKRDATTFPGERDELSRKISELREKHKELREPVTPVNLGQAMQEWLDEWYDDVIPDPYDIVEEAYRYDPDDE